MDEQGNPIAMPLTDEQVKTLLATQSSYGCGADACLACYPIQYSCAYCLEEFAQPIANGEYMECDNCGYDNNGEDS